MAITPTLELTTNLCEDHGEGPYYYSVPISCLLTVFRRPFSIEHSVLICLQCESTVGAFNQEKGLVGAFSVIVQPVVEPMDRITALILTALMCHGKQLVSSSEHFLEFTVN